MRKFILRTIIVTSIFLTIYYIISLYFTYHKIPSNNTYLEAIIDKHERICKINQPKIIFIGGSNLAFGMDTEAIESEFNVPSVNMGLHAGLGLDFILNEAKDIIAPKDVVFLSIEYGLESGSYRLLKRMSEIYPKSSKYFSFKLMEEIRLNIEDTRMNIKNYKKNKIIRAKDSVYNRDSFNIFGDMIGHLNRKCPNHLKDRNKKKYKYWEGISKLNAFYKYAKNKNVNVYFLYPCYPRSEYVKNIDIINRLHCDLSNELLIQVISSTDDFVFDDSLFYDTIYHLNKKGRELRTKKLIEIIKKNINTKAIYAISGTR